VCYTIIKKDDHKEVNMEIKVSGAHTVIPEAFRETIEEKLSKVEEFVPKAEAVEVEVSHENNPKLAEQKIKVEIKLYSPGPVVVAEAAGPDALSALDSASHKLFEILRRDHDKSVDHRAAHNAKVAEQKLTGHFDPEALEAELRAGK
jgi:ribosomal subunit interface protein